MPETIDNELAVKQLLAAAQLSPSEEEVTKMIADFPKVRAAADALYLDALENFEPAVKFDPTEYYV